MITRRATAQLDTNRRRRMLADARFVRDAQHIWTHPDGRRIGEGVALALSDEAFCRYLGLVWLGDLWE